MKIRTTVSAFIFVLALFVPVLAQSQTAKKGELMAKDEKLVHPVISKKPEPEQPGNYQGPEINATVVLKVIFRSSGKVTDIKVAKVIPEGISKELSQDLIKRCIKAAQKIKFRPATKDGHPVSMYMQLEYNFHLD